MAKCKGKKRHFPNSEVAQRRLEEILAAPLAPNRLYSPTGVIRCHCGGWVLTSRPPKVYRSGKRGRDTRVR
jgi:hypothetical protein